MEDSAAVGGIFIAGLSLWLTHHTGNTLYDSIGSLSIGGMFVIEYNVLRNENWHSILMYLIK